MDEEVGAASEKFCSDVLVAGGMPSVAARNRALDGDNGGSCAPGRSDLRRLILRCFMSAKLKRH